MPGTAAIAVGPGVAAVVVAFAALPLFALNAVVANRIEPFFSVIRPGQHTSAFEYFLLALVLLLLPAGAFIALRPLLSGGVAGAWHIQIVNSLVAVSLLAAFALLSVVLGVEIVRCDVLRIPNCD